MYWNVDISPEKEDEMIRKIAEKIHEYGMDVPGILFLESVKPLSYVGSQMVRMFVSPFLPILGEELGLTGDILIQVFENRENVEKIIKHLEEISNEEERKRKEERKSNREGSEKKWWKRIISFINKTQGTYANPLNLRLNYQ